jgi:hypothetical protein
VLVAGATGRLGWLEHTGHDVDIAELRRRYPEVGWHAYPDWLRYQRSLLRELCPVSAWSPRTGECFGEPVQYFLVSTHKLGLSPRPAISGMYGQLPIFAATQGGRAQGCGQSGPAPEGPWGSLYGRCTDRKGRCTPLTRGGESARGRAGLIDKEITMIGNVIRRSSALGVLLLVTAVVFGTAVASGNTVQVIYKNIPTTLPGNTVSQGFECCQTSEFGGQVKFPNNTPRRNPTIRIGLSSWACVFGDAEGNNCSTPSYKTTFTQPVTLNVYQVGPSNSVGAKVITKTATFTMPYRPSASAKCTTGESKGGWWGPDGLGGKACFHGKLFFIKFATTGLLPESNAIITVTYNTRDYGYAPTGVSGPSDSLNVALTTPNAPFGPPSVGEYGNPTEDYAYSFYEHEDPMCGGQLGVLGPTGPCDNGYQPLIAVTAS